MEQGQEEDYCGVRGQVRGGRDGQISLCCRGYDSVNNIMVEWERHEAPDSQCLTVDNCPFRGEGRPGVERIYMEDERTVRLLSESVIRSEVSSEFAKPCTCSSPISCPGRSKVP